MTEIQKIKEIFEERFRDGPLISGRDRLFRIRDLGFLERFSFKILAHILEIFEIFTPQML